MPPAGSPERAMADADKYNFHVEHIEEASQMTKDFLLTYYAKGAGQNELSMVDVKSKKVFLKRGVYDQSGPIRLEDLYVGGYVTVCARRMKIIAYADSVTRSLFEKHCEQVYTVIGAAAYPDLGDIFFAAAREGYSIKRVKSVLEPHNRRPAVAMEVVGPGALDGWVEAVRSSVQTRSAEAVHAEPSGPSADKVFNSTASTATFSNCALCIVRPHALREGLAGEVISNILAAGLEITAMQSFSLLKSQAENFYEVYKTVVPSAQYQAMVSELSSGLCLAMEVRSEGNTVPVLRELCGPFDVEIARHLRPNTLRAKLGRDNVHNVVHCTDLPEDGVLECQYFFSILPNAG